MVGDKPCRKFKISLAKHSKFLDVYIFIICDCVALRKVVMNLVKKGGLLTWIKSHLPSSQETKHSIYYQILTTEAPLQRCSEEKVFHKYTANLQENTHAEV